jgi:hypothetical protein
MMIAQRKQSLSSLASKPVNNSLNYIDLWMAAAACRVSMRPMHAPKSLA